MKNKDCKPEKLYLIRDTETGDLFTCAMQRIEQSHGRTMAELVLKVLRNNLGWERFEMVEFEEVTK